MSTPTESWHKNICCTPRVERIVRLLHPYGSRLKELAVFDLTAYFDEAGTHADSKIILVGGYIQPAHSWEPLDEKWKAILKEEGLEGNQAFYHAIDIEADPPRGIYEGWSRERADRLTDLLVPIAVKYAGDPVAIYMRASNWLEAAHFMMYHLEGQPHQLPYEILTKACIDTILEERSKHLPTGERTAFLVEDNDFSGQVLAGYQRVRRNHPDADRLGTLAFPQKTEFATLQAADLFAWHYRRAKELQLDIRPGEHAALHRLTRALMQASEKPIFREVGLKQIQETLIEAMKRFPAAVEMEAKKQAAARTAKKRRSEIARKAAKSRWMKETPER
jgi:hypothetical protein